MAEKRLSVKQKRFINAYLDDDKANFNATKAAELAGYKGNGATLGQVGYENLKKPEIAKEISIQLQASAMSPDESLKRIGDIGRDKIHTGQLRALELIAKHHGQLDSTLHIKIKDELDVIFGILEDNLDEEAYNRILDVLSANS